MKLTSTQNEVLTTLRKQGGDWIASAAEKEWAAGRSYYLDPRAKSAKGLRHKFAAANKEARPPLAVVARPDVEAKMARHLNKKLKAAVDKLPQRATASTFLPAQKLFKNKIKLGAVAKYKKPGGDPYTVAQVLASLKTCEDELREHPINLELGPGYVRGILQSILARGVTETQPGALNPDAVKIVGKRIAELENQKSEILAAMERGHERLLCANAARSVKQGQFATDDIEAVILRLKGGGQG